MKYIKSLFMKSETEEQSDEELQGTKIIKELGGYVELAENVYSSLFVLLKHIRNKSPRFFFLSDEQVLNILSMASDPKVNPNPSSPLLPNNTIGTT